MASRILTSATLIVAGVLAGAGPWRLDLPLAASQQAPRPSDGGAVQAMSPSEKREQCVAQRTASLVPLDAQPCTITADQLRQVATEWRRVMIDLCGSGEGDVDEVMMYVINPMRRAKCQREVTGQSLAPDIRVYDQELPGPPLEPAVLDALFELASRSEPLPLDGVDAKERDSVALTVRGSRVELADMMRKVKQRNGVRYTPPPGQRDTIEIVCGDRSERALFQCTGLKVFSAAAQFVQPLSFKNDVFQYTDRYALRQGVRIATATYAGPDLADGFSVKYSAAGIAERTLEIDSATARRTFLLGIEKRP